MDILGSPEDEQERAKWPATSTGPEVPNHPQWEVWEHLEVVPRALLILGKQWWFMMVDERDLHFRLVTDKSSESTENPCPMTLTPFGNHLTFRKGSFS